jgi:hypothetical protein
VCFLLNLEYKSLARPDATLSSREINSIPFLHTLPLVLLNVCPCRGQFHYTATRPTQAYCRTRFTAIDLGIFASFHASCTLHLIRFSSAPTSYARTLTNKRPLPSLNSCSSISKLLVKVSPLPDAPAGLLIIYFLSRPGSGSTSKSDTTATAITSAAAYDKWPYPTAHQRLIS